MLLRSQTQFSYACASFMHPFILHPPIPTHHPSVIHSSSVIHHPSVHPPSSIGPSSPLHPSSHPLSLQSVLCLCISLVLFSEADAIIISEQEQWDSCCHASWSRALRDTQMFRGQGGCEEEAEGHSWHPGTELDHGTVGSGRRTF